MREFGQPPMRFVWLLLLLVSRDACGETIVLRGAAQGTTYHIKYVAPASGVNGQRLQADVEQLFADIDREMSTYRPDSEISQFNRAPANEWFAVSIATAEVVAASAKISEKSGGAQDVTVMPLVKLWHFGPPEKKGDDAKRKFVPPTDEQVEALRKRVGYQLLDVRMTPPALRKRVEGLQVDLGSIASGYTIDHLSKLMADRGIADYMVELGGECRAGGKREDGTPWRIAIERPILGQRQMESAVPLVNAAMATSGGNHNFWEYNGRRYSHLIDPSTGRPVEHVLASVTVVADTCLDADGWDTPLMVLGPERGFECAEKEGLAAMFISHADGGDAKDAIRTTAAWRKRFGNDQN